MASFGPVIVTEQVRHAVQRTLEVWLPYCLSELEVEHGLAEGTIPRPRSYHGGVDDGSWIGEVLPEVMLLVSPLGEPERPEYRQWYLVDAKVACKGDQTTGRAEDEARVQAAYLGAALMLLIQQPSLGGLAQDLIMTAAPSLSFPSTDDRYIVQASARFEVFVGSIITQEGPVGTVAQPGEEQLGPPGAPTYKIERASVEVRP